MKTHSHHCGKLLDIGAIIGYTPPSAPEKTASPYFKPGSLAGTGVNAIGATIRRAIDEMTGPPGVKLQDVQTVFGNEDGAAHGTRLSVSEVLRCEHLAKHGRERQ
jgi:hypothetical protein